MEHTAALNEHIKLEFEAWYTYAGMALWLDMNDLPGCAAFLKAQSDRNATLAAASPVVAVMSSKTPPWFRYSVLAIGRGASTSTPSVSVGRVQF